MSAPATGGLFRRIFATFVLTVVASTIVSAIGAYLLATRVDRTWVDHALDHLEDRQDELEVAIDDEAALAAIVDTLQSELDADVAVYLRGRDGPLKVGQGADRLPPAVASLRRELRSGPVRFRAGLLRGHGVALALGGEAGRAPPPPPRDRGDRRSRRGRWRAVVVAMPRRGKNLGVPLVTLALLLGVLGGGAAVLSRSIARRLSRLGESAGRIASGDLAHRIEVPTGPRIDEIDLLGRDFNEMAAKVEALLQGQRLLLANVSHELRTPIARIKVLLEILSERVDNLRAAADGEPPRDVARLDKGMREMGEDVVEIEALISDLLTSGRLQLQEGSGAPLQRADVAVAPLLARLAAKVGARVEIDDETLQARLDELLMERLLSNLLANARRACPEGEITVAAHVEGDRLRLTVSDTGPGVPAEHREAIFEPFTRLDTARDRDRGGVGLGLYLARQICAAHGGRIHATDRPDGGPGAHFVVDLPRDDT